LNFDLNAANDKIKRLEHMNRGDKADETSSE
jgi:hypothetical protein